jgi:hypothetical protein
MKTLSTTMSSLPHLSSFLLLGLVPHLPSDMEDKCGICTATWKERSVEVIKFPCGHVLHQECIMPWITQVKGIVATCPYCRHELCTRAWRASEDDSEWVETRHAAIQEMAFDSLDAYMSEYAGEEEREGDWRSLFIKIIGQVCATDADSVEPCEAAEYLAVKVIMGSLERAFRAAGVETSRMQTILETFWEFENQPERGSGRRYVTLRPHMRGLAWLTCSWRDGCVSMSVSRFSVSLFLSLRGYHVSCSFIALPVQGCSCRHRMGEVPLTPVSQTRTWTRAIQCERLLRH